ncbi:MAG: sigma 54-interacting transcriptional regulator [Deltaproteobacteria bacterium]
MKSSEAPVDLTKDLERVALLAGQVGDTDALLERALDYLSGTIPYDLAAVLELSGDELAVRCARGRLANDDVRRHRIALADFPSVRLALESRRTRVLEEHDHEHEGDPYDGVVDLVDGHSCMVVPLFFSDRTLGAMTFDRSVCGKYDPRAVDLATIYGQIIGLAMVAAEQARTLHREGHRLKEENRLLIDEVTRQSDARVLVERSTNPAMQRIARLSRQVAPTDVPVLITGETGTGKEVIARAVHAWSKRADGPFVKLNCAALPEGLVESELFGHTEGAFSGATSDRPGRFAVANGGTLLLDEIGDLPLGAQAKLLRALQEGTFEPVGSDRTLKVDVRIIAATHVNLEEAMRAGRFREDLYYRLDVFPIELPRLADRKDDIVPIAEAFLDRVAAQTGRGPWTLSDRAKEALMDYEWPGNVRELENCLERATIIASPGTIEIDALRPKRTKNRTVSGDPTSWPSLSSMEKDYVERVLEATDGKIYGPGGAAEILGLKPSTLQSRIAKLGIRR